MASCPNCGANRGHIPGCSSRAGQKGKGHKTFITINCPTCRGSGRRGNRECGLCDGKGEIRVIDE